jgi:hypothetical protein
VGCFYSEIIDEDMEAEMPPGNPRTYATYIVIGLIRRLYEAIKTRDNL